ncbi:MAG: hypothetical protein KI792_07725 [Alphaproteobacteria bacterium]|nr:hypothetical protein [Alphaproteobacteria bacterium SS10]
MQDDRTVRVLRSGPNRCQRDARLEIPGGLLPKIGGWLNRNVAGPVARHIATDKFVLRTGKVLTAAMFGTMYAADAGIVDYSIAKPVVRTLIPLSIGSLTITMVPWMAGRQRTAAFFEMLPNSPVHARSRYYERLANRLNQRGNFYGADNAERTAQKLRAHVDEHINYRPRI